MRPNATITTAACCDGGGQVDVMVAPAGEYGGNDSLRSSHSSHASDAAMRSLATITTAACCDGGGQVDVMVAPAGEYGGNDSLHSSHSSHASSVDPSAAAGQYIRPIYIYS